MSSTSHSSARGDPDQSRAREEAVGGTGSSRSGSPPNPEVYRDGTECRPLADHGASEHGPLPHDRGSGHGCGSEQRRGLEHSVHSDALAYLITFTTYGTWLHGDERASVDRQHNIPGTPYVDPNARRLRYEGTMLKHPPVRLRADRRAVVHESIVVVCKRRNWTLHALNVRSNHVHVVVSAPVPPERVMNDLKSWATRGLVSAGLVQRGTVVWTRHGSTRYLWKPRDLAGACQYICEHQGGDLE